MSLKLLSSSILFSVLILLAASSYALPSGLRGSSEMVDEEEAEKTEQEAQDGEQELVDPNKMPPASSSEVAIDPILDRAEQLELNIQPESPITVVNDRGANEELASKLAESEQPHEEASYEYFTTVDQKDVAQGNKYPGEWKQLSREERRNLTTEQRQQRREERLAREARGETLPERGQHHHGGWGKNLSKEERQQRREAWKSMTPEQKQQRKEEMVARGRNLEAGIKDPSDNNKEDKRPDHWLDEWKSSARQYQKNEEAERIRQDFITGKITKEEMVARDHHSGGQNGKIVMPDGRIVERVDQEILPKVFKMHDTTTESLDTRQQVINSNNALTE